jgi:glycosyltransferase involved in cell wall biosynthesis
MILNSCVNGGGAGQSLAMLLDAPDARIEPYVVMPEPGVMAPRFSQARRLIYVPELVERMRRSPFTWPDRVRMGWLHGLFNTYALPRAATKLVSLTRELRPHVIYCNHMLAKPLGVVTGAVTGTPVVLHSRSAHHPKIDSAFYGWLGARRTVKRIIANSQAAASAYHKRSADKLVVIPNGLDPETFNRATVTPRLRQQLGLSTDALVVGYLGRLHPKKGVDWLIRSFAELVRRIDRSQLVIVGDTDASLYHDSKPEYRRLADSLSVGPSVHFI